MNNSEKQNSQRKSITLVDNTPSNLILESNLMSKMGLMSYEELYDEIEKILKTARRIKERTRSQKLLELAKQKNHTNLMKYITNFVLAGDRLSTNLKNYTYR